MSDLASLNPDIHGGSVISNIDDLKEFAGSTIAFSPDGGRSVYYGELGTQVESFAKEGLGYRVYMATSPGKKSPDSSITENDVKDSRVIVKQIGSEALAFQELSVEFKMPESQ